MILHIVVLLLANTILPLLPVPPQIAVGLPILHYTTRQISLYERMNLNRLHTNEQFKKSFKQSLKILHPDRGGNQEEFSKVKSFEKLMKENASHYYYDNFNITSHDL